MVEVRNFPILRTIPFLIAVGLLGLPAYAKYSRGSGAAQDPYQTATATNGLAQLGSMSADQDRQVVIAGTDEFRSYDLTVCVSDVEGAPIRGANIRAYSKEWYISRQKTTGADGCCTLNLPRGEWTVLAYGGDRFVSSQSGIGLCLVASTDLETDSTVELQPDHSITLTFLDRNAGLANVDEVYACPSDMVPNCCMDGVGRTRNGQSVLWTNLNTPMTVFFVRFPTSNREGYFLFRHNLDPNSNAVVRGYGEGIKHIRFDGRDPSNSARTVWWFLCFPNEDTTQRAVNKQFLLKGQGEVYVSSDYMDYMFWVWMRDDLRNDDVWYWSQYRGLDLTQDTSFTLRAGGPVTRQFHFCPIPFDSNRFQFLFGPILDAYGNEIRFYYPANPATPRFSLPITIWESQGGPVLFQKSFVVSGDNSLAFQESGHFPATAVFRIDWDLGPWGGTKTVEGQLFDPQYRYEYAAVESSHYKIHAPLWQSEKAALLSAQFEKAYETFVNLPGTEPPPTHVNTFYVHPVGLWCSPGGGPELYYQGFSSWHPKNPGSSDWEHQALHEIGHRLQADVFVPWSSPWFLLNTNGLLNEGAAEIIRQYVAQGLHGEKAVRWQKAMAAEWFFSYIKDPQNPQRNPPNSWNLFFFLDVYLPNKRGWRIHELFFRDWMPVCKVLTAYGYDQQTIYTALYSVLYGENLTWAFQLCDMDVSEDQVTQAMQIAARLIRPAGGYIATYVNGVWDRVLVTSALLGSTTGTFKIGREPFWWGNFWNGMIDDLRVYNRALSPAEIAYLADETPGDGKLYVPVQDAN